MPGVQPDVAKTEIFHPAHHLWERSGMGAIRILAKTKTSKPSLLDRNGESAPSTATYVSQRRVLMSNDLGMRVRRGESGW